MGSVNTDSDFRRGFGSYLNNRYVTADFHRASQLIAEADQQSFEYFDFINLGSTNIYAIKSANNKFVTLDETDNRLKAKSDTIGPSEKFELKIIQEDNWIAGIIGMIALKSQKNGCYLSVVGAQGPEQNYIRVYKTIIEGPEEQFYFNPVQPRMDP